MDEPDSGYIAKMVDGIIIEHDIDLKPFAYTRRAMALAILAERERCKRAVRDEMPVWSDDEYGHGKEVACENILEAIESGQ